MGDLGAGARTFIDWLVSAKLGLWQVLPLVPPGGGHSPYASPSAMAGHTLLIDLADLVSEGLLTTADLPAPLPQTQVDFPAVANRKQPLLDAAADRLVADKHHPLHEGLRQFARQERWVHDAALFAALQARGDGEPWWQWPEEIRRREPAAMAWWRRELDADLDRRIALQFLFQRQWLALRAYARERQVRIIGDVPIYVDLDSADVWAHPQLFQLDASGRPKAVAGVPPDYFSEHGQLWGNPLYDWTACAREGFHWWIERLRRTWSLCDIVRLDHFRGFSAYWAVPADAEDARAGQWRPGPGLALFHAIRRALGEQPLIAEDLGDIDEAARRLRVESGLPGMQVLQFAFGGEQNHPFLPHNHVANAVTYTGTHDNDTLWGWWRSSPEVHHHVRRYLGIDGHDMAWGLIRVAFASVAHTAIVPMQDVLSLGSEARMNEPGVPTGNWSWRLPESGLSAATAERLAELARLYGRATAPG
jgi:4-alpha-glucanotransferase